MRSTTLETTFRWSPHFSFSLSLSRSIALSRPLCLVPAIDPKRRQIRVLPAKPGTRALLVVRV